MIKARQINGEEVYDILSFDYEEDLSTICELLSAKYPVFIENKLQGPGTTIWTLKIGANNAKVLLVNNSYGNFFRPDDEVGREFFKEQESLISIILS